MGPAIGPVPPLRRSPARCGISSFTESSTWQLDLNWPGARKSAAGTVGSRFELGVRGASLYGLVSGPGLCSPLVAETVRVI
eukprot:758092-Hanusia_phi.AAC.1